MRSSIGIDVAAAPDVVFVLARDVTSWERLLPHYVRSRMIRREADGRLVCSFVAVRPWSRLVGLGIPVAWRSRTWSDEASRTLRFVHLAGATKGMDVTWRIEASEAGCRVTIVHDFDRALPLLGAERFARLVDRLFTRPIAGRTLATFKVIAEAVADGTRSGRPVATNPPT
jgi:ribosome-associated toxin RatA of RatAB toxin-antitoxin module